MRIPRLRLALAALLHLGAGAAVGAQTTVLQIKPRTGDTLRMRLDQESEMTGVQKSLKGEMSAMVLTTMSMFSRAIVEGANDRGTVVLAVTDSVRMTTSDDQSRTVASRAEQQMRGQRARFRVTPEGTVGTVEDGEGTREVGQVVSLMPATFPRSAIKVGESWIREMPLPAGMQLGAQLSGKLRVTFRLDSLTRNGDWAYVSMRGEMQPATGPGAASGIVLEHGIVNGTMLVDKKRGWLTDSWFNIVVNSLQTFAPSSGVLWTRVQTRITQHMHTFEKR